LAHPAVRSPRNLAALLLIATAAMMLAGCAKSPSSTGLTGPEKDREYTALVQATATDIPTGANLPAAGRAICKGLDATGSISTVEQVIENNGRNTPAYAEALLASAPGVYCPSWASRVTIWLSSQ
jgi:hypothetical protein